MDADLTRIRKEVGAFDTRGFDSYADKERVLKLTRRIGEELSAARATSRDVLCTCLDEEERLQLGNTQMGWCEESVGDWLLTTTVGVLTGVELSDPDTARDQLGLSVARRDLGAILAGVQAQLKAQGAM